MLIMHFMPQTDVTLDDIADIARDAGLSTSMYEQQGFRSLSVTFAGTKKWYWEDVPKNSWIAGELDGYELDLIAANNPIRIFAVRVRQVPTCELVKFLDAISRAYGGMWTLAGRVFENGHLTELSHCLANIDSSSENAL
jgi:hypothetical protein